MPGPRRDDGDTTPDRIGGSITNGNWISSLVGPNLSIDGNGALTAPNSAATDLGGLNDVTEGPLASRPAAGTAGDWYFTTDGEGVYYDDGTQWVTIANIGGSGGTDTRTDIENADGSVSIADALTAVFAATGDASVTVTESTSGNARIEIGATDTDTDTRTDISDGTTTVADATLATFTTTGAAGASVTDNSDGTATVELSATDTDTNTQAYSLADSDTTTLSAGSAVVDTGVPTDAGHYTVNINPGAADIAASIDGSGTNYQIHFEENSTTVGNPTVGWQLLRSEL